VTLFASPPADHPSRGVMAGLTRIMVSLALGFVATPLLVQWLGTERFGAFRATADWLGHITLLELGAAGALAPLVAAALGPGERHALRRAIHAGLRAFGSVAFAAFLLAAVITALIRYLVPVSPDLGRELTNACLVALVGYFLIPLGPFQVLLDAQQRSALVGLLGTGQAVVTTALALLFARAGFDLPGQFLALLIGQAAFRIAIALAARESLDGFPAVLTEPPDPETTARLRTFDTASFLTMVAGRVGYYTDNIIIALLLGPRRMVAFYLTQRLAVVSATHLLDVGRGSWVETAELRAEDQKDAYATTIVALTRMLGGLAVAALAPAFAFSGPFIQRWVGADFFVGDRLTALACVNAWLLVVLSLWWWCLAGAGVTARLVPLALVNAALNLGISIWATLEFGLLGPLIGTLAATVLVTIPALPILLARHLSVPFFRLALAGTLPLLWGIPAAWGLWTWVQLNPPEGWEALFSQMAASAAALLVLWWVLALSGAQRDAFRGRIAAALRG